MPKKRNGIIFWIAVHAAVILLGLFSPWKIETDLYSILPDSIENRNVSIAERTLSERSMRNVSVLLGHESFELAKNAAELLNSQFSVDKGFEETRLHVDGNAMKETREFLFDNRYWLQNPEVRKSVKNGTLQNVQDEALQKIYGAFGFADLNRIDEDPLLVTEQNFDYFALRSPLIAGKFSIRDGVLAAQDSNVVYVMWSGVLSNEASAMASEGHVLERLNGKLDSLKNAGFTIARSGVPFHSFESSRNAQTEIAWISGISITAILILLLCVFKTPLPIFCTIASISVAAGTALLATWSIFESIHIFTLVFGTSVIGVSIDYAIHFFTDWKNGASGDVVRKHILKGLLLGFMTTELSYAALTFANFPLLRQMAVFSLIGLASSLLTILFLFPCLPISKDKTGLSKRVPQKFIELYDFILKGKIQKILLAVFLLALVPGLYLLNIKTDMRSLYSMSDDLKNSEVLNARLNNLGISANYFIVEGASAEETLQNEERLCLRLDSAKNASLIKNYLATSSFLPSSKTQRESFENLKSLVAQSISAPEFAEYLRNVGVENDSLFMAGFEKSPKYLTAESTLPQTFQQLKNMLWIGAVENKFYSAVFPLHVTPNFDAVNFAQGLPGVYAVNKMQNINETLTQLSHVALLLVAVAYAVVFVILVCVYGFFVAVRIIRAPVISCLFLAAVFGYCNIAFNFFAIVGVILTLGIGIDYALFFKEGGKKNLVTTLAVMLSATTTVISFGSLAFSGFVPVATFGFATLLGIVCCFALSPLSRD